MAEHPALARLMPDGRLIWGNGPQYCHLGDADIIVKTYDWEGELEDEHYVQFSRDFPILPSEPCESGGWVAPDGKFYACSNGAHISTASYLADQIYGVGNKGTTTIEDTGWVHLRDDGMSEVHGTLTQPQMDTLHAIAQASTDQEFVRNIMWTLKDMEEEWK